MINNNGNFSNSMPVNYRIIDSEKENLINNQATPKSYANYTYQSIMEDGKKYLGCLKDASQTYVTLGKELASTTQVYKIKKLIQGFGGKSHSD